MFETRTKKRGLTIRRQVVSLLYQTSQGQLAGADQGSVKALCQYRLAMGSIKVATRIGNPDEYHCLSSALMTGTKFVYIQLPN